MDLCDSKTVLSKIFYRKTKRGNILKVVREHYLREDIGCGIEGCRVCAPFNTPRLLSEFSSLSSRTTIVSNIHLLIIDSSVALHQMDILEDNIFVNLIVPQTVMDELKHRSPPAYKRLKNLLNINDRSFYHFNNEFHQKTYIERLTSETSTDRNERAIHRLVKWYSDHVTSMKDISKLDIVLLSDDVENINRANSEGITAISVEEYVKGVKDRPDLVDKLARVEDHTIHDDHVRMGGRSGEQYLEHKSLTELKRGINTGIYKYGSFQVSRYNNKEAYVYVGKEEKEQIFVKGLKNCNRAIHDDVVVVELLPREKWTRPEAVLEIQELQTDQGDAVVDDNEEVTSEEANDAIPTGRVVGILKRNWRPFCGMLEPSNVPGSTRHLFVPAEKRVPRIRIETRQADRLLGQRIMVAIDTWPRDSRYPCGHFVRALGTLGNRETENEVILLEHDVPHGPFSTAVLNCLPQLPWIITEKDVESREDLRHLDIVSIDPIGCTDIDDALHCRILETGKRFEVGVHIADVSHFVRPGNAMDLEARERGTTVYLVDRRIDMLPQLLSSNLCSLRGNEDRFAFSVIWELTTKGEILKTRFCKSVIRSRAALTYGEAQDRIDGKVLTELEINESLRDLNKIAKELKKKRIANGALSLASLEIRFRIDSETREPIDVQAKESLETNSLVEEFMLLANISVAERILQEFPDCSILRRHPVPAPSNFEPLINAAKARNCTVMVNSGKELAESLDRAVIDNNPFFNRMLRIIATRCMTQAQYFCSGMFKNDQYRHFGLATPIYTHFTSPIRRYADLMVHRLLAAAIGASETYPQMLNKQANELLCQKLNHRHRMAQYAGRASVLLNTHLFFKDKSEDLEGYILSLRKNAFQVILPKYGLESAVLLKKDGPLIFDEKNAVLVGSGDIRLKMFDRVLVRLSVDTSNAQHEKLKLELIKPTVPGFSVEPIISAGEEPLAKNITT